MKIMEIKTLGVLLGLFHIIYAVHVPGHAENDPQPSSEFQEGYVQEEGEPSENFEEEEHEFLNKKMGEEQVEVESDSEGYIQEVEEPTENSEEEVQGYQESDEPQQVIEEELAEVESCGTNIKQGDTVALRTHRYTKWFSCAGHRCDIRTCPGTSWSSTDKRNCWGEVFQIFKKRPGVIRSGDIVGMHYPRQRGNWLGCQGSTCTKKRCPGNPTKRYGFGNKCKWSDSQCYGEVIKIYAYGKGNGVAIRSGDRVMFYFASTNGWLNGEGAVEGNNRCPGNRKPPSTSTYNRCPHEVFTITKLS